MKNVLVTATTFPRWKDDAEPNFVYVLSNLLAKKGYNITVLAPHHYGAKKFEILGNLKVYRFPYFYPLRFQRLCYEGGVLENIRKSFIAKIQVPFLFISELFYTTRIIKKEKIDLIHAHWVIPQGVIAAIIKKLYKIPFIATAHAGDIFPIRKNMLKNLARFALKNSSYITVNSSFTKNSILKIYNANNIEVIPMGINLNEFNPKKMENKLKNKYGSENKLILFVGRLAKKKGVEYLIKSMPLVLKNLPRTKLLVIGYGPEKIKLLNLTKELKIEDNVIFIGKVRNQDLPKYYATADLFVGPSIVTETGDTEGLGIVFLEALASGTCVIGSNVGGIPDIIKHNKTGILVQQKNSHQLAKAIVKILRNEKLSKRLVKNGQLHVKNNYSWNLVGKKFNRVFGTIA